MACMESAINYVQQNKDALIKEILAEIAAVQSTAIPIDATSLTAKINELHGKKSKLIDLVLEGIISREDLKRQVQGYDSEIESLSKQLVAVQGMNRLYQAQSESLQVYVDELNRMMDFGTENTVLYRELVQKIVVYKGKTLCVYLNCIPYGIKMTYQSRGRMKGFQADIQHIGIQDKI